MLPPMHEMPSYFDAPPLTEGELAEAFPGGFSIRDEANALTAFAFRNGPLERLHEGKASPLTSDPTLSRITDPEIKALMLNASSILAKALELRETDRRRYLRFVQYYGMTWCGKWER